MRPVFAARATIQKSRLTAQFILPLIVGALIFSLLPVSRGWSKTSPQYDKNGVLLLQDAPAKGPPAGSMSQRAVVTASGNPDIDALLSNCFWGESVVTFSFYDHAEFNGEYYGDEIPGEVSNKVKENFRKIFALIGSQIDIEFVEVVEQYPDTYGRIRVMTYSGGGYAYAYYPYSDFLKSEAGDIFLNESYDRLGDTNGFQHDPGKHGYMTLVHELGHALGLKHPHDDSPTLPPEVDNTAHTAMSYNFVSNSAGSYMTYDVRALQYLYGHQSASSDDTLYCFTEWADQYCIGESTYLDSANLYKQAIYDRGGIDTLDFSNLAYDAQGYCIDLRPNGWLAKIAECHDTYYDSGTSVCFNSTLENVLSSPHDDTIIANGAVNVFGGYDPQKTTGHDRILLAETDDLIDLSTYVREQVAWSQEGSDLVLALEADSSVTIVDYYAGYAPKVRFLGSGSGNTNHLQAVYQLLLH